MPIDPVAVLYGLLVVAGAAAFLSLYVHWQETGKIF